MARAMFSDPRDAKKKKDPVIATNTLSLRLELPQCHPINQGRDVAIIGAAKNPCIYFVSNPRAGGVTKIFDGWLYPLPQVSHTVVKISDHSDHSKFISFGGTNPHFDRLSLYPAKNKVLRVDLFPSIKEELPVFSMGPRGIYVNACGWSHLVVTGGYDKAHAKSISMIHFPSLHVTHFKGILPCPFGWHAMVPLSSAVSPNTLGFILIYRYITLECVYKKDENDWNFKILKKPPRVKESFDNAGWQLVQDKWIVGLGGNVDGETSKLIRIYNIARNQWSLSPTKLPEAMSGMGTCITDNDLHVVGGVSHHAIPLSMILGDQWQPPRPIELKREIEEGDDAPIRLKNPLVICVCIESYSECPGFEDLPGASEDKSIMYNLFTKVCGYSESNLFYNFEKGVTKKEWDAIIVSAKQRIWDPQSTVDGLIFYFAGHGQSNGRLLLSDNKIATIRDLQGKFDGKSCEKLIGRPKIMVFACCRGGDKKAPRTEEKRRRGPTESRWENATGNFLSVFPTAEGFQVFDPSKGSHISRAIRDVFSQSDLKSVHFQDLFMKISRVHEKASGYQERMNIHSSAHRHVYLK